MSKNNSTKEPIYGSQIAIIGAGPAGLVTARWLIERGLSPVIFEASDNLGGQWNASGASSSTWPGMRTNTSRIMTAFSDLDHPEGTPTHVRQEDMLCYLERYAEAFGLHNHLRLSTPVLGLKRSGEKWSIKFESQGVIVDEEFTGVIVASGRHTKPVMPEIPGLESFSGDLGAEHTSNYNGAKKYSGASVLVAGCSISALEIASELAYGGANSVHVAMRKQRYVLPKLIQGVPTDHVMFNRAAALAGEILPSDALAAGLKAAVLNAAGNPEQFGAGTPDENIFAAGISQSQNYLPAVAEGRITPHSWIENIDGNHVHFFDGTKIEVDAILFGTGFRPAMPWLDIDIAEKIELDAPTPASGLFGQTFHPDLVGLAFAGIYDLVGPYLPVLELQARWIAQVFAGITALPDHAEQMNEIELAKLAPSSMPMHAMAVQFSRFAGVEPNPSDWPSLERALLFGPLSPASFRLEGHDMSRDAVRRTLEAARAFGHIVSPAYKADESALRDIVFKARNQAA